MQCILVTLCVCPNVTFTSQLFRYHNLLNIFLNLSVMVNSKVFSIQFPLIALCLYLFPRDMIHVCMEDDSLGTFYYSELFEP